MASWEKNGSDSDQPTEVLIPGDEGDWPVAEMYRVEPDGSEEVVAETETVVVSGAPPPADPRRVLDDRGWPLLAAALLAAVALAILGAWLVADGDTGSSEQDTAAVSPPPTVTAPPSDGSTQEELPTEVPGVVGLKLSEARSELREAGYRVRVVRRQSQRPAGTVTEQAPAAGDALARAGLVTLVVAGKPADAVERIATPNVVGSSVSAASAALRAAGLRVQIEIEPSDEPAGTVLSQSPGPDAELAPGSLVTLTIAGAPQESPERVAIPDVVGLNAAAARSRLRAAGLRVSTTAVAASAPAGTVLGQSPRAGERVTEGSTVTLRVSTGPLEVDVPDVTGLDEAQARFELESAGFRVQVSESPTDDPAEDGVVVSQSPTGGASTREGALVTITVARFD